MSMDIFYKISDKVVEAGNAASDKARMVADVTKLNHKIRVDEEAIDKIYAKIGKAVYEARLNPDAVQNFTDDFQEIEDRKKDITVSQDAICTLKGTARCPQCGAEVEKDTYFCKKCGAKMDQK